MIASMIAISHVVKHGLASQIICVCSVCQGEASSATQPVHAPLNSGTTHAPAMQSVTYRSSASGSLSRSEPCMVAIRHQKHASRCITQNTRMVHLMSSILG